jgi:hypothetical protein
MALKRKKKLFENYSKTNDDWSKIYIDYLNNKKNDGLKKS